MTETKQALLPCPFCGAEPVAWKAIDLADGYMHGLQIECQKCGVFKDGEYEHEAIAAWNTRALPADWQPTPEAINALPEPLRAYIHRIETSHPSYDNAVRIRQLEEQVEQLQAALGGAGKDSERLDLLDSLNAPLRMGWDVRKAPAGNVTVTSVIQLGGPVTTIRAAIDAMAAGEDA